MMKAAAKSKVVTSGRLTGKVKVQPTRRRLIANPAQAPCPEPAYSLYSTESEDQVTSLHKGLDRCAALLSGILQTEKSDSPSPHRAAKGAASKSRPSFGKKTLKKPFTPTDKKSRQPVRREPGSATPRQQSAAHSGVKLHPPQRQPQPLRPSTPSPHPTPRSGWRAGSRSPRAHRRAEEDLVPVRDTNAQSVTAPLHTSACALKASDTQLEPGQARGREAGSSEGDGETKVKTVQYLLGELKALIAGEGSVAERLLSHLEQTVTSALIHGCSIIRTEPEVSPQHGQNAQLRRRVRLRQEESEERATAEGQSLDTLSNSEGKASSAPTLQEELAVAQLRMQELQGDLAELREALQVTQSQLRDTETQNELMKSDLETTRSKLQDNEREKTELASLAQQRLEEIGRLNRALQNSSAGSTVTNAVPTKPLDQHGCRQEPEEPPADHIAHYLMSLGQLEPAHPEPNKWNSLQLGDTLLQHGARPLGGAKPAETSARGSRPKYSQVQSCGRLSNSTLSKCDVESVWSDWSARSGSTFDTRDEAAFRDGLSALDASIASLQKTIQLDMGR